MKKYIALAVSLMMTLGCAQTAFAEVIRWNLSEQGDLNITESNVNPDGYEVTSTETTSNVIIVSNGVKTYIVLNNVDISSTESGITIDDGAEVDLELKGENSIYNKGDYAGINVANGKLIIDGTGSIDIETNDDGAGSIDIETNDDGAGIGSDENEDFTGVIIINGGNVTAVSGYDGAGIGAGDSGDMSGSITINGGTVTAESYKFGAGIGSGDSGNITETGKIHIGGDSVVDIYSSSGLGIGSGDYGNMNGAIIITDNADVKIEMDSFYNPTAIGSGSYYDNELEEDDEEPYSMNGSIQILENANISMKHSDRSVHFFIIGSSNFESKGGIVLSTGATINGISGSDIEKLLELGLIGGVDTENIESVGSTPESNVSTYELKALNLTQRIKKAQPGDTVTISEKQLDKGKLPAYAMEALAAADGVSLMIVCDDLAVIIRSDEAVADCGSKMFYTIDELVKMYE